MLWDPSPLFRHIYLQHLYLHFNLFYPLHVYGSASDCYPVSGTSHEAPCICTAPIKVYMINIIRVLRIMVVCFVFDLMLVILTRVKSLEYYTVHVCKPLEFQLCNNRKHYIKFPVNQSTCRFLLCFIYRRVGKCEWIISFHAFVIYFAHKSQVLKDFSDITIPLLNYIFFWIAAEIGGCFKSYIICKP